MKPDAAKRTIFGYEKDNQLQKGVSEKKRCENANVWKGSLAITGMLIPGNNGLHQTNTVTGTIARSMNKALSREVDPRNTHSSFFHCATGNNANSIYRNNNNKPVVCRTSYLGAANAKQAFGTPINTRIIAVGAIPATRFEPNMGAILVCCCYCSKCCLLLLLRNRFVVSKQGDDCVRCCHKSITEFGFCVRDLRSRHPMVSFLELEPYTTTTNKEAGTKYEPSHRDQDPKMSQSSKDQQQMRSFAPRPKQKDSHSHRKSSKHEPMHNHTGPKTRPQKKAQR